MQKRKKIVKEMKASKVLQIYNIFLEKRSNMSPKKVLQKYTVKFAFYTKIWENIHIYPEICKTRYVQDREKLSYLIRNFVRNN